MPNKRQPGDTIQNWTDKWVASVADYSICAISVEGRILTWNPGGIAIHGYQPDEIIGQMLDILYTEDDRQKAAPAVGLDIARRTGRHDIEGWRTRKDGTTFWASDVITALHTEGGQLAGFVNIVRDITDKKAAHDAVLESERRFRLLVNGVTDYAIFMLSPEGVVTNWNSGARRIKGYTAEEIIGSHFSRFYTPEDAATGLPLRGLTAAARDGRFEAEGWRVRKDGTRFWAHVVIDAIYDEDGTLAGFAKITRDNTERMEANRALEETRTALFQSQKMEAIGKLTGGVAHDFNNVLQVLRGNLELLENRHASDGWTRERLDKAIDAVERGAKLASQLLAFGRRQPLRPVVINLAPAIRGMDDLLRRALGETIEVAGYGTRSWTFISWRTSSSIWQSTRAMRCRMAESSPWNWPMRCSTIITLPGCPMCPQASMSCSPSPTLALACRRTCSSARSTHSLRRNLKGREPDWG
jgi:PAS domain S-box-containing protein